MGGVVLVWPPFADMVVKCSEVRVATGTVDTDVM
jgi:hypothetical protein